MQADSPTPVGRVALYVSKALKSFPRCNFGYAPCGICLG